MNAPAPGWHPDPSGRHEHRYWDGSGWTGDVADGGVSSTDPIDGAGAQGATAAHGAGYDQTAMTQPVYGDQTQVHPDQAAAMGGYGAGPAMDSGGYGAGMPPETPKKKPVGLIVGAVILVVALVGGIGYFVLSGDDKDDDKTEVADRNKSRGDNDRDAPTSPEPDTDDPFGFGDTGDMDDMFGDMEGMDDMFGDMEGMDDMFAGLDEMMNELYSDSFMRDILISAMVEDGELTRAEGECAMDVLASVDFTDLMTNPESEAAFDAALAKCGPGAVKAFG